MNIGKYEVLEELGHGAMGTVYKAHDPRLDRNVAIKLIARSATSDSKLVGMFEKEARAIARLSHPNIVTIFEFDYSDQQPYIVMELLKGSDLTDVLRVQHLTIPQKLNLVRQVCEGLAHAHAQNIIHRDIKPANIYLTDTNNVKITDFGIARLQSATMTTGSIMGTPEFMAPERLSAGKTDSRSDLFSTGVVLYWLLSGIRPFAADDFNAVFYRILNHVPPDLSLAELKPAQLQELNRIVRRSLEKDPEKRYSTAAAMADEIRRLQQWIELGTEPVTIHDTQNLHPPEAPEEFPKTVRKDAIQMRTEPDPTAVLARKRPFPVALAATAIIILIGALYGGYRFLGLRGTPNDSLLSTTVPASPNIEIGVATGKEKQQWMETYAKKFSETLQGRNIQIDVIPIGSQDAYRSIVDGDKRIEVWAPASDIQKDLFMDEWQSKYNKSPILEEKSLAIIPMVLMMWEERYQEFIRKYKVVSFANLMRAMGEKKGWATIANHPEWGAFNFGFSEPSRYNSGLVMLFMMAHEYHQNLRQLSDTELADKGLTEMIRVYHDNAVGLKMESSDLVADMIAKGPSSYDCVFTYESLALRSLSEAQGRWGKLRLIYPAYNFWMDNPFYVLDVPWSTPQQRQAASTFLQYLYGEQVQRELLSNSIRPANPQVPLQDAGSPFVKYKQEGIVEDLPNAMGNPEGKAVKAMLEDWSKVSTEVAQ